MYKDQMVYNVGDLVRVAFNESISKHNVGIIISTNEKATVYGVKIGNHVQKFHYSFMQPLSIKNCQGDI